MLDDELTQQLAVWLVYTLGPMPLNMLGAATTGLPKACANVGYHWTPVSSMVPPPIDSAASSTVSTCTRATPHAATCRGGLAKDGMRASTVWPNWHWLN